MFKRNFLQSAPAIRQSHSIHDLNVDFENNKMRFCGELFKLLVSKDKGLGKMTGKIRLARESDAPAVVGIYGPFCEDSPVSFDTTIPSVSEVERRIRTVTEQTKPGERSASSAIWFRTGRRLPRRRIQSGRLARCFLVGIGSSAAGRFSGGANSDARCNPARRLSCRI